jgi:hypothetical protein
MRRPELFLMFVLAVGFVSISAAASLDKAKTLRSNGLVEDAKRELVEITYSADGTEDDKATALMMLGDIALDEHHPDVARENWRKVTDLYPSSTQVTSAREKLDVLEKLEKSGSSVSAHATKYPAGTVLVVGPAEYQWSIAEISGALRAPTAPFPGSILEAMQLARSHASFKGIVEIVLDVTSAWETGRVVCHSPNGKTMWQEKVFFNMGGGAETIARNFVTSLAKKVRNRSCPQANR